MCISVSRSHSRFFRLVKVILHGCTAIYYVRRKVTKPTILKRKITTCISQHKYLDTTKRYSPYHSSLSKTPLDTHAHIRPSVAHSPHRQPTAPLHQYQQKLTFARKPQNPCITYISKNYHPKTATPSTKARN